MHCNTRNHFNADASSTFQVQMVNTQWGERPRAVKISYGSGQVVGYSVRDTVQLGSMQLAGQSFIIVEDAALPPGRNWDGICGFGWSGVAQVRPTMYESVQQQHGRALFTMVPSNGAWSFPFINGQSQAHMLVGETPQEAVMPNTLVWVGAEPFQPSSNSERTFWVVSGGVEINNPQPTPTRFIVDTGTNQVLLVPQPHYEAFIQSLIPSNLFQNRCGNDPRVGIVCDCSIMGVPGLRPLQIYLGGRPFTLPVSKMFQKGGDTNGGELCLLTIQPNYIHPSSTSGIGDLLGGLLGGLFGPANGMQSQVQTEGSSSIGSKAVLTNSIAEELPPLPFKMPSSAGRLRGAHEAVVEDVTEIIEGAICKATHVISHGEMVQRGVSQCIGSQKRRLQMLLPWPFGGSQTQPEEPWMIGGMFLEHFVAVFDFDNARLGIGEPAGRRLVERKGSLYT